MDLGLKGNVALVVASSQGLGYATARQLVREGARVVICGRTEADVEAATAELQALESGEAAGLVADVTVPADIERAVAFTAERFGGLDILVTNAGGPPGGTFEAISTEQWEQAVQLTLMSAVRLIKVALPYLRESQSASILTITSVSVKEPLPGLLLSNAIRPGVVGLTKTLSQELAGDGTVPARPRSDDRESCRRVVGIRTARPVRHHRVRLLGRAACAFRSRW